MIVISEREVVINAYAAGETDAILWQQNGTRLHYRISVHSPADRMQIWLGVKIAEVIFNEQIKNNDGSLTVNAIHVKLLQGVLGSIGTGDIIISSATCGPAGLPIPMASGAGLWIGLGLLGVVAAPVAFVALRRRASLHAA